MDEREHAQPEAFMADARARGVRTVVIAWQEEYGQEAAQGSVNYAVLRRLTLLAYHRADGTILRCQLVGGAREREELRATLAAHGFAVALRCRNQLLRPSPD